MMLVECYVWGQYRYTLCLILNNDEYIKNLDVDTYYVGDSSLTGFINKSRSLSPIVFPKFTERKLELGYSYVVEFKELLEVLINK